jgi:aminoglycoside 6'-N-acetyltransferase I
MRITDLQPEDTEHIEAAGRLLVEGFREHAPEWCPDMDAALEEVREALAPGRITRMALDEEGELLGWIAGTPHSAGVWWELHPLVVRPDRQGEGIGSALVGDLEARVRERGGITLYLGTADEVGQTTLSGVDLYPNVLEHLARIRNLSRHPYEFYQKQGFVIVGVIPDASGIGKPGITMAKRIAPVSAEEPSPRSTPSDARPSR